MKPDCARGALLGTLVSLSPTWTTAQTLTQAAPDSGPSLLRLVGAMLVCALTGGLLIFYIRTRAGVRSVKARSPLTIFGDFLGPAKQRRLQVLEATQASPHCAIVLVRCDGDEFLLGAGPQTLMLLDKRTHVGNAENL